MRRCTSAHVRHAPAPNGIRRRGTAEASVAPEGPAPLGRSCGLHESGRERPSVRGRGWGRPLHRVAGADADRHAHAGGRRDRLVRPAASRALLEWAHGVRRRGPRAAEALVGWQHQAAEVSSRGCARCGGEWPLLCGRAAARRVRWISWPPGQGGAAHLTHGARACGGLPAGRSLRASGPPSASRAPLWRAEASWRARGHSPSPSTSAPTARSRC
mmetsp:Transcript_17853/g.59898  ORF Transcript_17853/g.59898 Transcript_17853/m.59898 type:complete len:215 (-) Transcript_17853:425-1069(-)